MPSYLTFATTKVKIRLPSYFFPNSHGSSLCGILHEKDHLSFHKNSANQTFIKKINVKIAFYFSKSTGSTIIFFKSALREIIEENIFCKIFRSVGILF